MASDKEKVEKAKSGWFGVKKMSVNTGRVTPDSFWDRWEKNLGLVHVQLQVNVCKTWVTGGKYFSIPLSPFNHFVPPFSLIPEENPDLSADRQYTYDFKFYWHAPQKHFSLGNYLLLRIKETIIFWSSMQNKGTSKSLPVQNLHLKQRFKEFFMAVTEFFEQSKHCNWAVM